MKLILFDLDGVLVDIKDIHYRCLNEAISEIAGQEFIISEKEHLSIFDGLKTKDKLALLHDRKGLSESLFSSIWSRKQELTHLSLNSLPESQRLINICQTLQFLGFTIGCCSNSIRQTVLQVLSRLGIIKYFSIILSNEDVKNSKPHPNIYWSAMIEASALPSETLIIEDSPHGILAASRSGALVMRVKNSLDYNLDKIIDFMKNTTDVKPKWQNPNMNVIIPCAGEGSRFRDKGYSFPKPIIDVFGRPMIQWVVDALGVDGNYTFIVKEEHRTKYNLDGMLSFIAGPSSGIISISETTDGAARTVLLAKNKINNDNPMLIANSDQYFDYNSLEFFYKMQEGDYDAGILTFESTHPKWSYVKTEDGLVIEVAEKKVISNQATVGVYYVKKGSDFVKFAEQMISKNIRVNNEFYVAPVFQEFVEAGLKVGVFNVDKMWGLGTPEDLEYFIQNYDNKPQG